MSHDSTILFSLALGLCISVAGIALNRLLGGDLWALPTNYKPAAQYVYFGGVGVVLAGYAVAKIVW